MGSGRARIVTRIGPSLHIAVTASGDLIDRRAVSLKLSDAAKPELIAVANRFVTHEVNFKHLLALHDSPFFVCQLSDKPSRLGIRDIAG